MESKISPFFLVLSSLNVDCDLCFKKKNAQKGIQLYMCLIYARKLCYDFKTNVDFRFKFTRETQASFRLYRGLGHLFA